MTISCNASCCTVANTPFKLCASLINFTNNSQCADLRRISENCIARIMLRLATIMKFDSKHARNGEASCEKEILL